MDIFLESFSTIIEPGSLFLIFIGTLIAFIMGLLPGLSGTEAMLVLLPFTYRMNVTEAMLLLMSAYAGAFVGGSVTGILFGIPGCSTTIATVFDGFPLRLQGKPFLAIGAAATSSIIGGIISVVAIVAVIPFMVPFSLLFGPPEWFAFVAFGLFVLAFVGEGKFLRALTSGMLGILLGTIGLCIVTGDIRFTFGTSYLWGGIPIIPAFIGLYPLAESIDLTFLKSTEDEESQQHILESQKAEMGNYWEDLWEGTKLSFTKIRALSIGCITGFVIGVIPAVGATLANIMGYSLAKQTSKEPESFGKGNVEGVIAAESANNASVGGALIPALALGIPGSLNTAILLGILMLHGIRPGTNIFASRLDVTWIIILAVAAGTILASAFVITAGWRLAGLILNLNIRFIVPLIVFIGSIAAYLSRNNINDVVLAFILAFIGYGMKKYDFSRICLIIALILGPIFEKSYYQTLGIGRGSVGIMLKSPVVLTIFIVTLAFCFMVLYRKIKGKTA